MSGEVVAFDHEGFIDKAVVASGFFQRGGEVAETEGGYGGDGIGQRHMYCHPLIKALIMRTKPLNLSA